MSRSHWAKLFSFFYFRNSFPELTLFLYNTKWTKKYSCTSKSLILKPITLKIFLKFILPLLIFDPLQQLSRNFLILIGFSIAYWWFKDLNWIFHWNSQKVSFFGSSKFYNAVSVTGDKFLMGVAPHYIDYRFTFDVIF